jgi:hypothetical protein
VNHPCDELLAGARRTENEHGNVRLRRGADPLEDNEHLLIAADHFAEALDRGRLIFRADRRAPLEKAIQQLLDAGIFRTGRGISRGCSSHGTRDAEAHELADAIFDVHPEPAERLHQRVGIEAFFRPRAQITKDAGA